MEPEPIEIVTVAADSTQAVDLILALDDDLRRRYPGAPIHGLRAGEAADPRLTFFVARVGDRAVACGALRAEPGFGEIKRMYVQDAYRGRGIARRLLKAIESRARELGYLALRLETGDRQPEAAGLYESSGYRCVAPYGDYVGNPVSRCFEKRLA